MSLFIEILNISIIDCEIFVIEGFYGLIKLDHLITSINKGSCISRGIIWKCSLFLSLSLSLPFSFLFTYPQFLSHSWRIPFSLKERNHSIVDSTPRRFIGDGKVFPSKFCHTYTDSSFPTNWLHRLEILIIVGSIFISLFAGAFGVSMLGDRFFFLLYNTNAKFAVSS